LWATASFTLKEEEVTALLLLLVRNKGLAAAKGSTTDFLIRALLFRKASLTEALRGSKCNDIISLIDVAPPLPLAAPDPPS